MLYHHPAVREVGVVGQPDPIYGETGCGVRRLAERVSAEAEELREFARKFLADYKTPEKFVSLQALPKGLTGKVQRRAKGHANRHGRAGA